jgi:enoyl-CoA hydratase
MINILMFGHKIRSFYQFGRYVSSYNKPIYENIIVETKDKIGIIQFNRPGARNALNSKLMKEFNQALHEFEVDNNIRCIIITGSVAGADIKEMVGLNYPDVYLNDFITSWEKLSTVRKPTMAVVNGYAFGGGCEIAMMCDIIIASETAEFSQPETKLGIIPGLGGTQRLTHLIGKSKTMDLVLTGRTMGAIEAERLGLVSRIFPANVLMDESMKIANQISQIPLTTLIAAKESVNYSLNSSLDQGLKFERRLFHSLFATSYQKEGMRAFVEKRKANFE